MVVLREPAPVETAAFQQQAAHLLGKQANTETHGPSDVSGATVRARTHTLSMNYARPKFKAAHALPTPDATCSANKDDGL